MRGLLAWAFVVLAGCGREEVVPAPSAEENAQLDEAEDMLDNLASPPAER